jgi:hypothetical protein
VLYFDKPPKKRLVGGPNQEPDQCDVVIRNSSQRNGSPSSGIYNPTVLKILKKIKYLT